MILMEKNESYFIEYINKFGLYTEERKLAFERYCGELERANASLNLFSRKMPIQDIWTRHFLDSVSILEVYRDWSSQKVLDFGTGGGLPGIPLKILYPQCEMVLLDSIKKKILAVNEIVQSLCLQNISCVIARLESKEMDRYVDFFDVIVCRAVKITPILRKALLKVLKKKGKIFLYKAINLDDVRCFEKFKIHKLDLKFFEDRKIVEINYG